MPEHIVRTVLWEYGDGMGKMLKFGEKSRLSIPKLGSFKCTPNIVNRYITYEMMTSLRYNKRKKTEKYEFLKTLIRRAWAIKQDGIRFIKRKNAKYYPSANKNNKKHDPIKTKKDTNV